MPQLGIYFDLRNPDRWHQDPARLHAFTLEVCEEAERLGAGSVWLTEHHLFDDGYLTSPLTMAAAVADVVVSQRRYAPIPLAHL